MQTHTIEMLSTFVGLCDFMPLFSNVILFRGQPISKKLLPSIARSDPSKDPTKREREAIRQMRLLGASLLTDSSLSDLDVMVLAQHFGHHTRLLDWTTNPLAALWFACASSEPGDAYVYGLEANSLLATYIYEVDPFEIRESVAFQPRNANPRVNAQHGWFTLHPYSDASHVFVPLEEEPTLSTSFTGFKIPEKNRNPLLQSLDLVGVNERTLLPDLVGLSRYLNWKIHET